MKNFKKKLLRMLSAALGAVMLMTPVLTACGGGTEPDPVPPSGDQEKEEPITPPVPETPWEDFVEPEKEPAKEYDISPAVTSEVRTMFTLPAIEVEKTGIYEVHFKFTTEAANMYLTVSTQQQPIAKTGNMGFDSNVDEDGYVDYPWFVYLEEGENNLTVQPSQVGTFTGYKLEFVKPIDVVALATTPSDYTEGQSWGALWQPTGGGENYFFRDVDLALEIAEEGFYDFSYFATSINIGEFYLTITDANGLVTETCSNFLTGYEYYYPTEWQMHVLFGEHIYKTAEPHTKPSVTDNYLFYLKEGTYSLHLSAPHLSTYCTLIFGGAIFGTKIGEPCEHDYHKTGSREVTCYSDGGDIFTCSVCGVKYLDVKEEGGHTYANETFENNVSHSCTRCGLTEVKWDGIVSAQTASPTHDVDYTNYEKATFQVNVPKAGVYRVNFAYTAKNGEEAAVVKNAALINVTEGKGFSAVQAFNHFSPENDGTVAAGYTGGGSYASQYLEVYLAAGNNTLELHTPEVCRVTLTGARFELYKAVDIIGVTTGGKQLDHTKLDYCFGTYTEGSKRHGLGIMNTMLADNGTVHTATTTLHVEESGWYDIGYFVFGFNGAKLYLTLTKGGDTIEMHTEANVPGTWDTDHGQPMIYDNKLSVFNGGNKVGDLVYLTEGDWTVSAKGSPQGNGPNLYFGNAVFATRVTDKEECTHVYVPMQTVDATCVNDGYTAQYCKLCGVTNRVTIPAKGHSYKDQTPVVSTAYSCSVCGVSEVKYEGISSTTTASTTGESHYTNYEKTTFEVTVAKSGIYKVYFAYDATNDGAVSKNAGLFNVTADKGYEKVQAFHHFLATDDEKIPYGFKDEGKGYASQYIEVYLDAGKNTLALHTPDTCQISLKGVYLELEAEVTAVATTTGGFEKDDTCLDYVFGTYTEGSKRHGLGVMNTMLSNSGTIYTATGTLKIAADGWYDLGYFVFGFNGAKLYVTLTKEGDTVEMHTEANVPGTYDTNHGQPMIFQQKLSVFNGGDKVGDLVYLTAGDWTVSVKGNTTNDQNKPNLYFGNAIFATKIEAENCAHNFTPVDERAATCTQNGQSGTYCAQCGTSRVTTTPATGHSYKAESFAENVSHTCTVCGTTETKHNVAAVRTASETGDSKYTHYYKTTFTITLPQDAKSGAYRVQLAFTAGGDAYCKNAILINVTDGKNFSAIQSYNHFSAVNDGGLKAGYTNGDDYSSGYLQVYMTAGANTLELRTPDTFSLTLKGSIATLEKATDAFCVTTGGEQLDHTRLDYGFGTKKDGKEYGLGLKNTRLADGGNYHTATGTLEISKSGTYELSYLGTGFNNAAVVVTLKKGEETIELRTENLNLNWDTIVAEGQTMLLRGGLAVYQDGARTSESVVLSEGQWTVSVTVAKVESVNPPNLYFGNAIFASIIG